MHALALPSFLFLFLIYGIKTHGLQCSVVVDLNVFLGLKVIIYEISHGIAWRSTKGSLSSDQNECCPISKSGHSGGSLQCDRDWPYFIEVFTVIDFWREIWYIKNVGYQNNKCCGSLSKVIHTSRDFGIVEVISVDYGHAWLGGGMWSLWFWGNSNR